MRRQHRAREQDRPAPCGARAGTPTPPRRPSPAPPSPAARRSARGSRAASASRAPRSTSTVDHRRHHERAPHRASLSARDRCDPVVRAHSGRPMVTASVSSVHNASTFRFPRSRSRSPTEFVELSLGSRVTRNRERDGTSWLTRPSATSSTASWWTARRGRPTTSSTRPPGEVYASAPKSGAEDVDRAYRAAEKAFEAWGDTTPSERQLALLKIADALEKRAREFVDVGVPRHRQADRLHHRRGAAAGDRPDPVLRRRGPRARGQVRGGVPQGPHLVRTPRADRRGRPGDAVELPADDDGLEDRARAGGRQLHRAQAERHHAGLLHAARRAGRGVPAAGRAQRGHRRP